VSEADPVIGEAGPVPGPTARKPRGQYRNGILQRERILESATDSFARHGYAGASLRQIATEVGVTHGAIMVHFGNKEALLMAVLDRWTTSSFSAQDTADGIARIRALTDLMREHLSERRFIELFMTMASEATDAAHPAHDLMVSRYEDIVARLASSLSYARDHEEIRWLDDDEITRYARRIVAMMDGLQIQWLLDPSVDLVADFDDFIDALIQRIS
jgi:AcrR family transcriptional regulator